MPRHINNPRRHVKTLRTMADLEIDDMLKESRIAYRQLELRKYRVELTIYDNGEPEESYIIGLCFRSRQRAKQILKPLFPKEIINLDSGCGAISLYEG